MLVRPDFWIAGGVAASFEIRMSAGTWAFLTGEYPPQRGGVADYTHLVAEELAKAGEAVHVWTRRCEADSAEIPSPVTVHRLPAFDGESLSALEADLERLPKPVRIAVQYVPHAFGWNGMNVPFCRWLTRQPHSFWVIFHEVRFAFRWNQPLRHNVLAFVTDRMASMVARAAERVYVTIPAWERSLPPSVGCRILPVPSTCATEVNTAHTAAVRNKLLAEGEVLVGHFGTYGKLITPYLRKTVPALLNPNGGCRVVLLGSGSMEFAADLARDYPACEGRLCATGALPSYEVACHLAACDVVLQPYPDGVTGRRSSLMSPLALGRPIVTTTGHLTEPFWQDTNAVVLVPAGSGDNLAGAVQDLLDDPSRRQQLGTNAMELYRQRFALQHTIDALLS